MRQRLLLRLSATLACLLLLAAPASSEDRPVHLVTFAYPPFVEVTGDKPATGMMIDTVTAVFSRMGRPMTLETYPLARALRMLEIGEADGLFTIKKTPEREAAYFFPKTHLLTQDFVFFVLADSDIEFNGDLKNMTQASIGVVQNTSYGQVFDTAARSDTFKRLEPALSFEANFKKLLAGRMDAVVCSRIVGMTILKKLNASKQVRVTGPPIETARSYIAFNRSTVTPALVAEFDRVLGAMQKDGTMKAIEQQYAN
jgi:polar amino acid transport system substrate-binding protein